MKNKNTPKNLSLNIIRRIILIAFISIVGTILYSSNVTAQFLDKGNQRTKTIAKENLTNTAHVIGGSNIINQAQANQIAGYLNEGNVTLINIFSKTLGDGKTAANFHTAADGMGRTITITRVSYNSQTYLIGGYNPQSWRSTSGYIQTPNDVDRTAFLFNLTSNVVYPQKLNSSVCGPSYGPYQTYTFSSYGPTFGGGHDFNIATTLEGGYFNNRDYGPTCSGTPGSNNILNIGQANSNPVQFLNVEVFRVTLAPTAASVSVGGRITSANGNGIKNVGISLTDSQGNVRTAISNPFGYYTFDDLTAGETVILSVSSKSYSFDNPTQVLTLNDSVTTVNFIGHW